MRTDKDQPTLTEADAKADLAGTLRPDNPSTEGLRWAAEQAGTAPKVTPADIEAEIASEHYFTAADGVNGASSSMPISSGPLHLLTFCVLVLRNGFTVTGESACASPANFDAEVGRKVARQAAVAKCWPLMGFALRCEMTGQRPMAVRQAVEEPIEIVRTTTMQDPNDFGHIVTYEAKRGTKTASVRLRTSRFKSTEAMQNEAFRMLRDNFVAQDADRRQDA